MRRRPRSLALPIPTVASPGRDKSQASKVYYKDAVSPFLVSGGSSYFLPEFTNEYEDVRKQGIQLVTSVYIPKGAIGFLKQLRVAPFRPAVFTPGNYLIPVQENSPLIANWQAFNPDAAPEDSDFPTRPAGVWEAPFQWENYFNSYNTEVIPPSWRWYLRIIPGNIDDLRLNGTNLPTKPIPFTEPPPADYLDSWFLIPDVAVPDRVYPGGIPGSSPGSPWDGQRVQVIQGDELTLHVPIPEHSTLCLFTRWRQSAIPASFGRKGDVHTQYTEEAYYPLLPSFGQLLGYTQSSHQAPGNHNAQYGWNG